ncbi:GAF and ANTAR domain-containing protein [Kineococcus indalonis]|uniref:GAF and ANTAR domain-containing protein n=1 Tax=Kineococcus indalonis TaxID=2696566 RepID=UPI001411B527|nr:ANTAR domain-containing protein [Kineococcus indalonis]NAZ85779.1 ANTAR domain-containing protein [Kineococcus indalonis]
MTSVSDPANPEERVAALAAVAHRLHEEVRGAQEAAEACEAVVRAAEAALPGLLGASVTVRRGQRVTTVAGSGDVPRRADDAQYAAGQGPCLEAIASGCRVHVEDTAAEGRWPRVTRSFTELGVRSVLSSPLVPVDDLEWAAGLNLYAAAPAGFDPDQRARAGVLQAVAAGSLSAFAHRRRALNLEEAVASNRDIGAAVGVLMALRKLTREQAMLELRRVSQNANRKLRDVAAEVLDTGQLSDPAVGAVQR